MSSTTVLIIDDDPISRSSYAAILGRDGYEAVTAADGPSGIRTATELRPDVILLDVMMPGMDGFEVTRQLRAHPALAEVPILLLTALDDPQSRVTGLEAGADDFLSKPVDRVEFRARLRAITRLNRYRRLIEQREQSRRLFDRSPCGLTVIDAVGRVREANPEAERLLEAWLGPGPHDLRQLLPADDMPRFDRLLVDAADPAITARDEFCTRIRQTDVWFDVSVCWLSAEAGTFLAAVTDRTAQRTLEMDLRQAQKLESIGQLAGGVAHDFNNLLTVINGYTSLALERLPQGDPGREGLEEVYRAGERAALLTRQLLTFARRSVVTPTHVALSPLVRDIEKMLRRLIGESVAVRVEVEPGTGVVWADPTQVEQVLFNLAANARDAMPVGGTLTIGTAEVTDPDDGRQWVRLTVADTGCGMPPEVRERIFEPFFTTKELGKGTGLGLATVYGIVQQCGGRLQVDSEVGRGTTFVVDFPRLDPPAGTGPAVHVPPKMPRGSETVLLAEDEDVVRAFAEVALTAAGYTVLTASDGTDALATAAAYPGPIHLLFTDTVMPGLGGRELAERLLRERPGVKVLCTSGYDGDMLNQHAGPTTMSAFVQKPYTALRLLQAVREAIDQ